MDEIIRTRPYDNFRLEITEPEHFFGRKILLENVRLSPFEVRILLGGSRIGKSSTLLALASSLLDPHNQRQALPVFLRLQLEQPNSFENFLYLLATRFEETALQRNVPAQALREKLRLLFKKTLVEGHLKAAFVDLKFENPERERKLEGGAFRDKIHAIIEDLKPNGFEGVCFLLDGVEFVVRSDWTDSAWNYLRSLKEDFSSKSGIGLILSGYKDPKSYQQKVGSPLGDIADIIWLTALDEADAKALLDYRLASENISLDEEDCAAVLSLSGNHPYLLQQTLNAVFDDRLTGGRCSPDDLIPQLIDRHHLDFIRWWNPDGQFDGFGHAEHSVYRALLDCHKRRFDELVGAADLRTRHEVLKALKVLAGTGVIQELSDRYFAIGAKLFEHWFKRMIPQRSQCEQGSSPDG